MELEQIFLMYTYECQVKRDQRFASFGLPLIDELDIEKSGILKFLRNSPAPQMIVWAR